MRVPQWRPSALARASALALVGSLLAGACTPATAPTSAPPASPTGTFPAGTATPIPTVTAEPTANLPKGRLLTDDGAQTIRTQDGAADFLALAGGYLWGTGISNGVGRWDAKTGAFVDAIPAPDRCEALDVGFGSVWSAGCDSLHPRVIRFDGKTGKTTAIDLPAAPRESEASIGVGESGVWLVVGREPSRLVHIDPATNAVVGTFDVPDRPAAVRVGAGAVWLSEPYKGLVYRVDPATGAIVATIKVGRVPEFIAFGEGALWTMNQADGTVSRVDPTTNAVTATIDVGERVEGGDIAVGGGFVWLRGNPTLLLKIDPATNTVVAVYGPNSGSGSVAADADAVWVSAHDIETIWRLPLR